MPSQASLDLIIGITDSASGPLKGIAGGLAKVGDIGATIGKALGGLAFGGAVAGVGALSAALVTGIGDAREHNLVMGQTQAVIASTGSAAGFTADQIADMAGSLSAASGKSLFGDDDIQRGQNMLLTFTNISDQLPATTQTMLDLAQATGGDMQSAALQLGKALNDPSQGLSALTRVGVTFTEQQRAQVEAMQAAGDMAGAQSVILQELQKEFGGSAAAAAAADGGMAMFKDRMGELAESIGAQVLPMLNQLMAWLNSPEVQTAIVNIGTGLVDAVKAAAAGFESFLTTIQPVVNFVKANLTPILAGLAAMLVGVVVPAFLLWVGTAASAAAGTMIALAPVVIPIAAIGAAVALLAKAWTEDWGGMRTTLTAWWNTSVKPIFDTVKTWLSVNIPAANATLKSSWETAWTAIKAAISTAWSFMQTSVFPPLSTAIEGVGTVISTLQSGWSTAWSAIQSAASTASGIITGVINTIKSAINTAISAINTLISAINSIPSVHIPSIPSIGGSGGSGFGAKSIDSGLQTQSVSSHTTYIDARGSADPRGIEAAVDRAMKRVGVSTDLRLRTT